MLKQSILKRTEREYGSGKALVLMEWGGVHRVFLQKCFVNLRGLKLFKASFESLNLIKA